jgi:hypothetical protein
VRQRGVRTKRAIGFGLGVVGLVVAAGIASAPAQAKVKKVKVETETFIDEVDVDLGETLTFTGHVECEKPKCAKQRRVDLRETGTGTDAGFDRTDASGNWEIVVSWDVIAGGSFVATAEKRKIKKRRNGELKKVFKCRGDSSAPSLIIT